MATAPDDDVELKLALDVGVGDVPLLLPPCPRTLSPRSLFRQRATTHAAAAAQVFKRRHSDDGSHNNNTDDNDKDAQTDASHDDDDNDDTVAATETLLDTLLWDAPLALDLVKPILDRLEDPAGHLSVSRPAECFVWCRRLVFHVVGTLKRTHDVFWSRVLNIVVEHVDPALAQTRLDVASMACALFFGMPRSQEWVWLSKPATRVVAWLERVLQSAATDPTKVQHLWTAALPWLVALVEFGDAAPVSAAAVCPSDAAPLDDAPLQDAFLRRVQAYESLPKTTHRVLYEVHFHSLVQAAAHVRGACRWDDDKGDRPQQWQGVLRKLLLAVRVDSCDGVQLLQLLVAAGLRTTRAQLQVVSTCLKVAHADESSHGRMRIACVVAQMLLNGDLCSPDTATASAMARGMVDADVVLALAQHVVLGDTGSGVATLVRVLTRAVVTGGDAAASQVLKGAGAARLVFGLSAEAYGKTMRGHDACHGVWMDLVEALVAGRPDAAHALHQAGVVSVIAAVVEGLQHVTCGESHAALITQARALAAHVCAEAQARCGT